jgi:hypothetical protein
VLHILLQISNWSAHLYLVLPFILSPLLFELKFSALSRLEGVDEVNLNFIDIDDEWYIATG